MNTAVREQPSQVLAVMPESAGRSVAVTPMEMLAHAMASGADLAQLQHLMDLQDRWEANNARKAYVGAMATFKRNPPEILKRKHVEFQTSKGLTAYDHATLADVCYAAIGGLAAVGISHNWDVSQQNGLVKVTCVLTHEGGHQSQVSLHSAVDDSGGKNAIQALGSAITYLQRYTLLAATGLAAADMDDDGHNSGESLPARDANASAAPRGKPATTTPQPRTGGTTRCTEKQAQMISKKIDSAGVREKDFFARFEVGAIAELPFAKVDEALAWIKDMQG